MPKTARWLPLATASLGLVGGVAAGSLAGGTAFAHEIDTGDDLVRALGGQCVYAKAEIKHNDSLARYYGKVRSKRDSGDLSCYEQRNLHLRLKLETLRASYSGGTYSVCLATIGDGMGDPGFEHTENPHWEMGRVMTYGGDEYFTNPCGGGLYRLRTTAEVQNGGWTGGVTWTTPHDFTGK